MCSQSWLPRKCQVTICHAADNWLVWQWIRWPDRLGSRQLRICRAPWSTLIVWTNLHNSKQIIIYLNVKLDIELTIDRASSLALVFSILVENFQWVRAEILRSSLLNDEPKKAIIAIFHCDAATRENTHVILEPMELGLRNTSDAGSEFNCHSFVKFSVRDFL